MNGQWENNERAKQRARPIQHNHVLSFNSGFVRLSAHGLQATFSGWSDWPEKGDRRRSSAPKSFHLCKSIMKLAPKAQS